MLVKRTEVKVVDSYEVGDKITFALSDGEEVEAMAIKQESDGMIFVLVDCLKKEYPMNKKNTNKGGYENSDLRKILNSEILDKFPAEIRGRMTIFENGDCLRLLTQKEVYGENYSCVDEPENVKQFEAMKSRRNRIAFEGKNGDWQWWWLQNVIDESASSFALVNDNGFANYSSASPSLGVRPAFKLNI